MPIWSQFVSRSFPYQPLCNAPAEFGVGLAHTYLDIVAPVAAIAAAFFRGRDEDTRLKQQVAEA